MKVMSMKHCYYVDIAYCPDLTSPKDNSVDVFRILLWDGPDPLIESVEVEDMPEMDDIISTEVADCIVPLAMKFIEDQLLQKVPPQLIMSALSRRIFGTFFVSSVGEEVRKDRDSAA